MLKLYEMRTITLLLRQIRELAADAHGIARGARETQLAGLLKNLMAVASDEHRAMETRIAEVQHSSSRKAK